MAKITREILFTLLPFLTWNDMTMLLVGSKEILVFIQNYLKRLPKQVGYGLACLSDKNQHCLQECFHFGLEPFLHQLGSLAGKQIFFHKKEFEIQTVSIHLFPFNENSVTCLFNYTCDVLTGETLDFVEIHFDKWKWCKEKDKILSRCQTFSHHHGIKCSLRLIFCTPH